MFVCAGYSGSTDSDENCSQRTRLLDFKSATCTCVPKERDLLDTYRCIHVGHYFSVVIF